MSRHGIVQPAAVYSGSKQNRIKPEVTGQPLPMLTEQRGLQLVIRGDETRSELCGTCTPLAFVLIYCRHSLFLFLSSFLNRPLLPCGVEGFLLVNLLDNW
jgi:hypothetical protein